MNIDITSVSRKEQKLSRTPAAVYVVTREAIQRSGATTIPDLLRIVPDVQVAQIEANRWAISVRGFNDVYSNKLLVLVDGRTVYTSTFSGVYWDQLNIPLDTIARIEVIRGPGGAVWGANAVNGVINIITEHSSDTQGTRITAGAGSFQTGNYEARFGGKFDHFGTYRVFGGYASTSSLRTTSGEDAHDGWNNEHLGFRADGRTSTKDAFVIEGSGFKTDGGSAVAFGSGVTLRSSLINRPLTNSGFDVLGHWTHTHSESSESSIQIYESNYTRNEVIANDHANTIDFDFQNHVQLNARNDLVWGAGYRFTADHIEPPFGQAQSLQILGSYSRITPPSKEYSLFSTFLQDDFSITKDLTFTVGTKVEHNAFSGFEYEPSARLAWTPTDTETAWFSASRAVRQPSRIDTGLQVQVAPQSPVPGVALNLTLSGNPQLPAERVQDYEGGYRMAANSRVSLDVVGFYSIYTDLSVLSLQTPSFVTGPSGLVVTIPSSFNNLLHARNYGAEGDITWNILPRWKLTNTYSWLRTNTSLSGSSTQIVTLAGFEPNNNATVGVPPNKAAPRHQAGLQSYFDLTPKATLDSSVYYVNCLCSLGVPAYTRVDVRLGYQVRKNLELSLVGQNLLQPRHLEFINVEYGAQSLAVRSIFGRVVWSF